MDDGGHSLIEDEDDPTSKQLACLDLCKAIDLNPVTDFSSVCREAAMQLISPVSDKVQDVATLGA